MNWLNGWGFPCGIETPGFGFTAKRAATAKWLGIPVRD